MKRLTLTLAGLGLLAASAGAAASDAPSLHNILSMRSSPGQVAANASSPASQARFKAMFQAAQTYAAQSAYCHRAAQIKLWLNSESKSLDIAYNFASLLLDGGRVLPPIIQQVDASYAQKGNDMAVTAMTTWHILSPARIVSAAPNWRNYLYLKCAPPLKPNPVLLPGGVSDTGNDGASPEQSVSHRKNSSAIYGVNASSNGSAGNSQGESAWARSAKSGWKLGTQQANEAFALGMHRLTRDYLGMLRFWWLARRGVVSTPILAKGHVGIRVDGRTLSVGETVFRLTKGAGWNPQPAWKPVIQPKNDVGN